MENRLQPDELSAPSSGIMTVFRGFGIASCFSESALSSVSVMMQQLAEAGQVINNEYTLNNTRKAGRDLLFFNRVPKVGSQTFMELLRRLSSQNKFEFYRDKVQRVETIRLAPAEQLGLAAMINNYETPGVFIKHVCFINFTKRLVNVVVYPIGNSDFKLLRRLIEYCINTFANMYFLFSRTESSVLINIMYFADYAFSLSEPIYLNVVRDPVERVISWYYYVRAPWYYVERKQAFPDLPLPDVMWLKKVISVAIYYCFVLNKNKKNYDKSFLQDYETCIKNNDRECQYNEGATREGIGDHRRQSMFFCGHNEECIPFNSAEAIEKAKRVVDEYYAVVGVLEDMNTTLTVLEHYIPKFFKGAVDIYYRHMEEFRKINKNIYKPPVSEEIKEIVRKNFTREIEFYQFCRQKLHKQFLALKLSQSTATTYH
ncbi:hypothetical protein PGB90_006346 [Kerria lacca]